MLVSMRFIIWNILYFWKLCKVGFDNVKCTIVGMFVIDDDFTLRCGAVTIVLLWWTWSWGSWLLLLLLGILVTFLLPYRMLTTPINTDSSLMDGQGHMQWVTKYIVSTSCHISCQDSRNISCQDSRITGQSATTTPTWRVLKHKPGRHH